MNQDVATLEDAYILNDASGFSPVFVIDYLRERLLSYAHYIAKNYSSQFAYEELKREIINFIKNGGRV